MPNVYLRLGTRADDLNGMTNVDVVIKNATNKKNPEAENQKIFSNGVLDIGWTFV